ncbi:MAG: hypothetical protein ABI697_02060 [Devosia sp.]
MRIGVLLAALSAFASPAIAADSVADQAQHAYDVFAASLSQRDFLSTEYGKAVFSGIDGRWARLAGPDAKTGIESYGADTDKVCKSTGAQVLHSPNPLVLDMTTTTTKGAFTQSYVLIAGSTFGEKTDLATYLVALGLGPGNTAPGVEQQRAFALSVINGVVEIYRPSPDILVLARDRGYPLLFARCPTA